MSARQLATGCALAVLMIGPIASAAAPSPTASKSPARKPVSVTRDYAAEPSTVTAGAAPSTRPSSHAALSLSPSPRDQPTPDEAPLHTRFALTLNPLPLAIGRYGVNVEYVLASHHAIVASAYLQTFSRTLLRVLLPSIDFGEPPSSRLGGELGYRLYSGRDGPTGLFIGPSAVAMPIAYPRVTQDLNAEVVSFNAYGGALDVGVQAVVGPGFTIGGGVGVMALAYTPPSSVAPPPGIQVPSYPEPHVLPRLLMMAGWAF